MDVGAATLKVRLTPRQLQILKEIARGRLYKEIAFDLNISIKTVETHMQSIQRSHECNLHRLLVMAERQGLLSDVE